MAGKMGPPQMAQMNTDRFEGESEITGVEAVQRASGGMSHLPVRRIGHIPEVRAAGLARGVSWEYRLRLSEESRTMSCALFSALLCPFVGAGGVMLWMKA